MTEDVCYSVRYDVTWRELQWAMSRVKRFRKQGLYLVVEQNDVGNVYLVSPEKISQVTQNETFTVHVMGPPKFLSIPIKNRL